MNPKYPVYVVSKGRWESRLTIKALIKIKVPFKVIVEAQEFDNYANAVGKKNVLVLDKQYQDDYNTCDNLGDTKSKGPGAARNFAWDHSIQNGFDWHWVMDDNMRDFYRLHKNMKYRVASGTILKVMEDFVERYENVAQAGPQYEMFVPRKYKHEPFVLNTRIYSCLLIRNDLEYRWRGRYNEDTDLSLRVLKAGWCTVLFRAFLVDKVATSLMKGGNTEEFYADEGTLPKSRMQVQMHPDVSRLTWKWGRWHHHVDYSRFKHNKLIRKKGTEIQNGIDNYGMVVGERKPLV